MASSRRSTNPRDQGGSNEPFPSFPGPSSAPSHSHPPQDSGQTHSTSTTVTTTTVIDGRNDPVTTTSSTFPSHPNDPSPPTIVATDPDNAPIPFSQTSVSVPVRRRPIGVRRLPSVNLNRLSATSGDSDDGPPSRSASGRRRSASAPQNPQGAPGAPTTRLTRQSTRDAPHLGTLREDATQPQATESLQIPGPEGHGGSGVGRHRSVSNAARSIRSRFSDHESDTNAPHEYENEVVDYLDVIDPEVSTLTTLTNVQNSLFVPDLGRWINRRPTYTLSRAPSRLVEQRTQAPPSPRKPEPAPAEEALDESTAEPVSVQRTWSWQRRPPRERTHSISSVLTDSHYAVLPHGMDLDGWSEEDKEALDDHVRHMLHSRRSKFKQRMKAFGKYVSKPLGFFVTLYAFLITMFGLAWVLFLIGWISVGDQQSYLVNVIDNVLVALFAVVGDGLAPFRVVDTYHMIWIAKYHYRTWEVRKKKNMPELKDHNDLPEQSEKEIDPEAAREDAEFAVLTPIQQKKLIHHQVKFSKSHSFYKPHETSTHHAFPIKLMITAVVLLDCHSIFQIMLGTFTWAWSYHTRPTWITTVILCFSITVNILAGIIISIGDRKSRKKDVVMRLARQELTSEAIKKVQKHKADREASVGHAANHENFEVIREEEGEQSRSRSQEGSSTSFHSTQTR